MQQTEHLIQKAFFDWWRVYMPNEDLQQMMFAIPNGGARNVVTGKKLKAEGVRRGIPDVFLAIARLGYHGLFIEFKAGKNKPSKEQAQFIETATKNGYLCVVCYDWVKAKEMVEAYMHSTEKEQIEKVVNNEQ